jgi:hypothetical protein
MATPSTGAGVNHQDPVREAWGGVHIRDERLADACSRFEHAAVELLAAVEDAFSATTDAEHRAAFQRRNAVTPDLNLFGDATLMFADATTNTVAEAIRITWEVDEGRQAWSFGDLLREMGSGLGKGRSPGIDSQVDRFHAVYVAVNVPRHVLAVHGLPVRLRNPPDRQWRPSHSRLPSTLVPLVESSPGVLHQTHVCCMRWISTGESAYAPRRDRHHGCSLGVG